MRYKPSVFIQLLQVAFIVLKLCGVIQWRWIWVLAPMWMWTIIATAANKRGV